MKNSHCESPGTAGRVGACRRRGMPAGIAIWFTESWLSGDYHFVEKGRYTPFESCPGECAVAAILEARNIPADLDIAASGTVMSDAPAPTQFIVAGVA
jgi:hypothetical protein